VKSWVKILFRIVLVSLYAILVLKLVEFALPDDITFRPSLVNFLPPYLLIFILNTEGCLFYDRILNKRIPWTSSPRKRLIIQFALIVIWSVITMGIPFTIWYFYNGKSLVYPPASVIVFIGSIVFMLGFIGISIAINFFKQWQSSILDAEHYKQEKLKADYRVLQNQVNPHFLFNSLNVLISEIKHSPEIAIDFTRKLSKVYRYVLQSKNHDLISLQKELEFIESFIFLHKVRVGNAIEFSFEIPEAVLVMQLPPLTLQILIENAIKHNAANEQNVLRISVSARNDNTLIVRNNLHGIDNADSTNTGLSNLAKRFELLKQEGFKYEKTTNEFVVNIPLIED
jgi:two-component system, LytTR family, sensor kinase